MATLELGGLTDRQARFYQEARRRFRRGEDWIAFEEFAFGRTSPLYEGVRSRQEVLETPLYRELKRMWIELGVRQGAVRRARRA